MLNSKLFAPYSKAYSWYKFLSVYLLIAVCFWLNLQCMSFTLCEISGTSMLSTLQHGQVVVVQTKTNDLDRGDIVVFDAGKDDHIKRIIGMPGDTIQVTRNGAYLSMAYVNSNNTLSDTLTVVVMDTANLSVAEAADDTGYTATVTNGGSQTVTLQAMIAAYDADGRMVTCTTDLITVEAGAAEDVSLTYPTGKQISEVKLFLVNAASLQPVTAAR